MIRLKFLSGEDRCELLSCVKRQREDHGVARRANALLLLDDGKSCVEIAQVLYLDDDTVRGWHKQYLSEGWIDCCTKPALGKSTPIHIAKDVLGNTTELLVSPNHRMLVVEAAADLYFGERELLICAKHLLGMDGINHRKPL
jgi:hypothetical protein